MTPSGDRRLMLVLRTIATALDQALATNQGGPPPGDVGAAAAAIASYARRPTSAAHPRAPVAGAVAREVRVVGIDDTAAAIGHPDPSMNVLGSPQLALWFELSTSPLMPDPDSEASHVGVGILVHHVAGATLGEQVTLTATAVEVSGRAVLFTCEAHVGERLVAFGVHQRVIVVNPSS